MNSHQLTHGISRNQSPIAILLDPERDNAATEEDIRVEDYLDDKIQSVSDFGALESLIASVETQQKQLKEQLQDAQSKLTEAKLASANRTSAMFTRTREFKMEQARIEKRLMIVTNSDTPTRALQKLKGPMEKLRKLELAYDYVELLRNVESLKVDARKHLPRDPKLALQPYTQLKELSISLKHLQEPAEGAAIHLVTHVQETTLKFWNEMKKIMCDDFESILQKGKWPNPNFEPSREWSDSFGRLLDLQSPELMTTRQPLILLPMGVLARNFILQFRYHFFSDKPTNHPHRLGGYFFEWFLATVSKWEGFLYENLSSVLASHFRGSSLAGNPIYVDPLSAFITALLPILQEKVNSLVEEIADEPQYLSRFMIQMMDFDDAVRSRFRYDADDTENGWSGLTTHVLEKWYDVWYRAEKRFALQRYQVIVAAKNSGELDYDVFAPGKTKASYGAMQVTDLITTITLKYHRLRALPHRLRFLIGIQAEILDLYEGRLNDALEYFQTATSTVGRTIHGVTKEELEELQGIKGLEKLCRVFGSAEHLLAVLKDWTNDGFFIELYDQLQGEMNNVDPGTKVAGEMTATEVKQCTSSSVGSSKEGSLFDVTIRNFDLLRKRAESLISQCIKYNFPADFRQYISNPHWTMTGDGSSPNKFAISITPELDRPLHILRECMLFLHRALADAPFRRIWCEAIESLQDLLFNDIVLRQDFTHLGSIRFVHDVAAIQGVVDSCMPPTSRLPLSMPKLQEAAALLSLSDRENGRDLFRDVYVRLLAGNQEAVEILEQLGFVHLSNADARTIMARRIDWEG